MLKKIPKPPILHRDGTSQAGRIQDALSPDYVSVDERTIKDLLAFARDYACELKYFNSQNREAGDWSSFISPGLELDEVLSFMEDPKNVTPEKARHFSRPHFALFLTFLKLLSHARQHLNTLTRRHLEFYYEEVLCMSKKAAIADQVNILAKPARDVKQFSLPAGTLLSAGPDSQGKDRLYRTERDIVVNHSQIAKLSSLYVDKEIIGIRQAREGHKGTNEEAFIQMLMIAFGEPLPGDSLLDYKKEQKTDYPFLLSLAKLVRFTETDLFLPFFEFRKMMELKGQRDGADSQWNKINQLLEKAGKKRTGKPDFQLNTNEPRNFDANLVIAVGKKPNYDGLPQVENITDLYEQRNRQDVKEFISTKLYFENIDDFVDMMQIKVLIDNEWKEINRIIEQAGQRKRNDRSYRLAPENLKDFDPTDFNSHLKDAVNPNFSKLPGIANIDQYYVAVMDVEKYFFMTLENFSYLMAVAEKTDSISREWDRVYKILADAHKVKVYTHRRQRLRNVRENESFDAMLYLALGEEPTQAESSPLKRLKEFVRNDKDYDFLETISQKIDSNQVEDKEWDRVYPIVELAQRIRERLPEPVAQKEEWHNFYSYDDAASVVVTDSTKNDKDNSRWKTFGQQRPEAIKDNPPLPIVGWAISTPLLGLSQGNRRVTLTLGFQTDSFDHGKINPLFPNGIISTSENNSPFLFEISTQKGWIVPNSVEVKKGNYQSLSGLSGLDANKQKLPALQFTLTFEQDVDALAPLPAKEAQFNTPWPVLRLMMRQIWKEDRHQFIIHYPALKELELVCTHVKVDVSGLTPSHIQNDETVLDANKPFEPFGSNPLVGSRFFLGHPELVNKKLDNLTFHIEWMGVPNDLKTHYKNYDETWPAVGDNFTIGISLINKRLVRPLKNKAPLFSNITNVTTEHSITISNIPEALEPKQGAYEYKRILDIPKEEDLLLWSRYLQWDLNSPDFQHNIYPALAAKKSTELAAAIAKTPNTVDATLYQVSPPYTPTIKKLTLEYTSSVEINLDEYKHGVQTDQIFHIHPFGYNEVQSEAANEGYSFLPQYNNEGELYIGIEDVTPQQNLSVLFQMAEGSADPDLESVPIQWTYLSGDRWISLHEGNILLDTTRGLINSGIIEFRLDPVKPNTRLPKDYYWLRAAITHNSNSVCDAVAIETQALSATFVDNNNAPDHYSRPLAVNSISSLAEPQPEITSVQQPYTSFGGKMEEQDTLFYTRVSERLRHKQRALTLWDYEHLILERFPQVYKAKCLPSDVKEHPDELGKVEIIIIPDIRNQQPFDPFEPKASANMIADIESYLLDKTPAYASVKVRNAHYVAVKVRVGVRFKQEVDEGYFKELLNKELNRFLSPWAYEEGADIVIGGKIYANSIIDFIDKRNYVDYVAGIKLFSNDDGQSFKLVQPSDSQGYFVAAEKTDSVLVAARGHEIDIIYEIDYEEKIFTGINYMKLELDFIVASD